MDDAGTMDAGLETTDTSVAEAPDSGASEQGLIETPVESATTEGAQPQEQISQQTYKAVVQDEKGTSRLDAKAKATIDKISAEDPQLGKQIRDALFEADRIKRALPEGLAEVRRLRETFENLGGEQGIQEAQQEMDGWHQFDSQYMAGDPKALEFMLSSPESQQAFLKLAPLAFNKFEELNPEGYAAYICQRMVGDAMANGIPVSLQLIQHFLQAGDAVKAGEQFDKILKWFQAMEGTAKKQVEAPKSGSSISDDPRYKDLESREANLARDEWRRETATEQNAVYASELNKHLAGRKVTDVQREDILHRVQTKLGLRIKEHEKTLDRYFAVRDKEGFLKFANSFSKKHIPELVREAVDRYVPQRPGPKAAPQNGQPVKPPVNGAKPEQGFTRVNETPRNIDWANPFNTPQNIRAGKGITTDGKRVQWK